MGVWGQSPQRGPGAESILVIGCPTEPANLAPLVKFSKKKSKHRLHERRGNTQRLPRFLCEYRGEVPGCAGGVGAYA